MARGKRAGTPGAEVGPGDADERRTGRVAASPAEGGRKDRPIRLVVGIGASAGGLDAFKAFLTHMPRHSGMAFVLVQHLEPHSKSLLAELLSRHTEIPVAQAEDGMAVVADQVFVIPPNAVLTIEGGILRVATPAPPREQRRPIDLFFAALAADQDEKAVAIILSGSGSDGSLGLKAIKEHGGFTLAQAGFDAAALLGMPSSAAATGFVDEVLPVERMPERLLTYGQHLNEVGELKAEDGTRRDAAEHLKRIFTLLRARLGHDFSEYKESTLIRRIQRRMQVLQIDGVPAYIERLRKEPIQLDLLFHDLLIGVTQFFRDPEAFAALESEVIPKLLENKRSDDQVRIWVPGCATGEETYSIAILLKEAMIKREAAPRVQIFASDIDETAVAIARQGRYRKPIAGVSPERLERWFAEEGDDCRVNKDVREMCIYSTHNLIKDPPFAKLDLISCRNLLIYLDAAPQARLVRTFHYALRPSGYLFLGPSEGVARNDRLFAVLDKKHRLFQRRADVRASLPAIGATGGLPGPAHPAAARPARGTGDTIDLHARQALEKFSPAYVVINQQHDVVRFSGRTSHYIEHSPGVATLNLFTILRKDLLSAVRTAVQDAMVAQQPVIREDLVVAVNGHRKVVNLIVEPIAAESDAVLYVVAFQDRGFVDRAGASADAAETADGGAQRLEKELRATQAQLQSAIDDLQMANEELKSSNEEYQSINEEFQSANEELESSKEELQSTNEELHTINGELNAKNQALTEANSDIKNLLDSTEIATVFLDSDLRIKNFTPAISEVFHLRASDRGRPITEIVTRLGYADLKADVTKVLRSLSMVEQEVVVAPDGPTFVMRIRPYRTVSNVIDGVVITFVDITERKRHEEERGRLAAIVDSSQDAIIGHSFDGKITSWNAGAETIFGYTAEQAVGKPLAILLPEHQMDEVPQIMERLACGERVEHFEISRAAKSGKRIDVSMTISPVRDGSGAMIAASTVARDITERKRHEEERATLAAIIESSRDPIISINLEGVITSWNDGAAQLFGYAAGEAVGRPITILYPTDYPDEAADMLRRIAQGESLDRYETVRLRKDGSRVDVSLTMSPVMNSRGNIIGASKIVHDITERKRSDELRILMANELNHRVKNTLAAVQSIAAQSLKGIGEGHVRDTFDARLVALSKTHDLLARDSWEGASLRELLRQELEPYRSDTGMRFAIEGPDLALLPKTAVALGMAFHELAINAVKYGALSKPEGQVRVTWDVQRSPAPSALRLTWAESGGPPVKAAGRKGFGSVLIERSLAFELNATIALDFAPGGLVCTMEIPLEPAGEARRD
jgi:two-component system CheB/CheR fusion protein